MILGIDEVGRGPWAGPLVVGAVVLGDTSIDGLTDSKKLTKKKRETLDVMIRQQALGFGLGWVQADEIDQVGLAAALRLATIRAVEQVKVPYHEIIIDGTINFLSQTNKGRYVTTLPKGDMLIPAISAASIIAKVARDAFMTQQDQEYPGYNFTAHVGYGTATHRQAIDILGVTPLHRRSFAPIAKIVGTPTTKAIGDKAEEKVAEYLQKQKHTILERNWRTKFCEIDIVSQKGKVVYFTEVKYRRNARAGDGFTAITPSKLKQMKFATEFFAQRHKLTSDLRLCVASVSGDDFVIDQLLELE
ncbi:MAG: ribonuclease HII [Candidatus Microsaccharimonas sp.]